MNMNNSMLSLVQQDTAITTAATTNSNTASPRTARFTSSSSANNAATTAGDGGSTATTVASKQQEVDFIKLNYVLTRPPPAPEGSSQAKQKAIAAQEVIASNHAMLVIYRYELTFCALIACISLHLVGNSC
jgi:hypothetical protein